MSLDTALDAALGDPTADAGTQDQGTAPVATEAPQGAPTAQPEPTYTRADLDAEINRAVQQRLSRRSLEEKFRTDGWLSPAEAAALQQARSEPKPEPDPSQQWVDRLIEQKMQERLAPIQAKEVSRDLDAAITGITASHGELKDPARLNEVLDTVIELGLDKATHLTVEQALEVAYRYWRQFPDLEAIKKQAADEAIKGYTTRKVETASKTPRPEGAGTGAVTPAKKISKVSEMESALEAALSRIE